MSHACAIGAAVDTREAHRHEGPCWLVVVVLALCECEWTQKWNPADLTMTMQHGNNPEQSRVFADRTLPRSELCPGGHSLEMEQWIVEVAKFAHRVEEE